MRGAGGQMWRLCFVLTPLFLFLLLVPGLGSAGFPKIWGCAEGSAEDHAVRHNELSISHSKKAAYCQLFIVALLPPRRGNWLSYVSARVDFFFVYTYGSLSLLLFLLSHILKALCSMALKMKGRCLTNLISLPLKLLTVGLTCSDISVVQSFGWIRKLSETSFNILQS